MIGTASTMAVDYTTDMSFMPQSSTEYSIISILIPKQKKKNFLFPHQSASSILDMDFIDMLHMGVDNYQRFQEISNLKAGWDGNNARPISERILSRTKDLLIELPSGAKIFPTGRSTVQIEYHKDEDNYFEIEVSSSSYEFYCMKGDNEFEGNSNKRDLLNRVKLFLE